jgi:hypothetical protein
MPTVGSLAIGETKAGTVDINFAGCAATARFAATLTYSDGGAAAGSKALSNQFQ